MIHLCLNIDPKSRFPLTPFLRVTIKDPLGHVTTLFKDHVLLFPGEERFVQDGPEHGAVSLSWLVWDRCLSEASPGSANEIKETLKRLHSGKHYYFPFDVSKKAVPGRYTLISEMQLDGQCLSSLTQENDVFWVDIVRLKGIKQHQQGRWAMIENPSSEPVPAVLVRCPSHGNGGIIQRESVTLPAQQVTELALRHDRCFLTFSEDREVIFLTGQGDLPCVIRNQGIESFQGRGASDHLALAVPRNSDTAFELTAMRKKLWDWAAQCPTRDEVLSDIPISIYNEMLHQGLIFEFRGEPSQETSKGKVV